MIVQSNISALPLQEICIPSTSHFYLPAAFSFQHLQGPQAELKEGWFSPGWKGRKCSWAGQAAASTAAASAGSHVPSLPVCSSPCHSPRDPVFACALPQLSESLDPCLLFWPLTPLSAKTSNAICSFVLVTTLSWMPQLAVNTAQTEWEERERGFRLVNWVVKKQEDCFFFFWQVTCLTCIGQPFDLINSLVPMVNLRELSK